MAHRIAALLLCLVLTLSSPSTLPTAQSATHTADPTPASSSVMFIENVGQFAPAARFLVWSGAASYWLTEDALWLTVTTPERPGNTADVDLPSSPTGASGRQAAALRFSFPGATPHARLEPLGRQDTRVSFFQGADRAAWRTDVPVWRGVRYVDLLPGLDLEIGAVEGELRWRLAANGRAALADSPVVLLVEGADDLTLTSVSASSGESALRLNTPVGERLFALPDAPLPLRVEGALADGRRVTLAVPAASASRAAASHAHTTASDLPANLLYSTFLGSTGQDEITAVATGSDGSAYVTGNTLNDGFPRTPGSFQQGRGIFVTRLNPAGSALDYVAILGGSGDTGGSWAYGIAIDPQGQAYVTGETTSAGFPTTPGAFDITYNDLGCGTSSYCGDAFVIALNAIGTGLVYGTYLGGEACGGFNRESGLAIAADDEGNAYVTGRTYCATFPTTPGAYDRTHSALPDAFVTKLNATGSDLSYSTFLGGGTSQYGNGIAVDGAHNAYIAGFTRDNEDFSVPAGGHAGASGSRDILVAKLNAAGSERLYGVSFGGMWDDTANGIAVDHQGNTYVTGIILSPDFPTTAGAFDPTYHDGESCNDPNYCGDGFVAKLDQAGATLLYSTILGESGIDSGMGVVAGAYGRAYVTGWTRSSGFPVTPNGLRRGLSGFSDGFLAVLKPDGSGLDYGTYLGGSDVDLSNAIAGTGGLDPVNVLVAGRTSSWNFPITSAAYDQSHNGYDDGFIMRWAFGEGPLPTPTPSLPNVTMLFPREDYFLYTLPQNASKDVRFNQSGTSPEWSYVLTGDMVGTDYFLRYVHLGSLYGNPNCVIGDLLLERNGARTTLWSTGTQCNPVGYPITMDVSGSSSDSATQSGDRLLLRFSCVSWYDCGIRLGGDTGTHIEVPKIVSGPTPTPTATSSPTPTITPTRRPTATPKARVYLPLLLRSQ